VGGCPCISGVGMGLIMQWTIYLPVSGSLEKRFS